MDTGKQIIEKSKREEKSKEVVVKFYTKNHFKVYDGKQAKYIGHIAEDGIYNSCSCPSFKFGMKYPLPEDQTVPFTSLYFAEYGHTFQCKHIIAAVMLKEKTK